MATAATDAQDGAPRHGYRAVWRWHFLAALWTAPFLIILTLSGAIYLFDLEFDGWWNRESQTVAAGAAVLPLARQEALISAAYPGGEMRRVRLPRSPQEASIWTVQTRAGKIEDVYLDPYRGEITGTADPALQPMNLVRKVHGTLLGGEVGSYVVELVACWTLVMMATGIWLWWPRKWKAKGVVVPRLSATGRRFWRDLHSIPAIFNAAFVILLVLTGLPWSAFWGPQFARLGEVVPFVAASPNFKAAPQADGGRAADPHAMHKAKAADPKLPWAIQHSVMPAGTGMGGAGIADMERLLPALDMPRWGSGARITYPHEAGDAFILSYVPDKAEGQRTIYVDPANGRILGNIGWADYSPVAKAVEWGVMTHMGRQYGLANQLANLAVCLLLVGSTLAGMTLWWTRRPKGKLGAPELRHGERLPGAIQALLIALAILFPLVGATMLLVAAAQPVRRTARAARP
jgi:hypothetical protein